MAVVYWIRKKEHTDIKNQGYVGVTKMFRKRMNAHKNMRSKYCSVINNAISKNGWDTLVKEIVFEGPEEGCYQLEEYFRPTSQIGYNIAAGGRTGVSDRKISEEGRLKISQANSGSGNPMYGKKHTDETKKMISEQNTGRVRNVEFSKRQSEAQTGLKHNNADRTLYRWEHFDGTIEELTKFELRTKYGLPHENLHKLFNGKSKSFHGWRLIPKGMDRCEKYTRKPTKETRDKLSKMRKGKMGSNYGKGSWYIITNIETEEKWLVKEGIKNWCEARGLYVSSLSKVAKGLQHSHKGYKAKIVKRVDI